MFYVNNYAAGFVQVHLIPVAKSPGSVTTLPAGCPDPWDGAAVVAAYPELSIASQKIQQVDNMPLLHYYHFLHFKLGRQLTSVLDLDLNR